MASLRRHRRGIAEVEDYDDSGTAGEDTDTATDEEEDDDEEEEEEEEGHRLHLGLHSMTAKVHCSILLLPTNACHFGMN
jgi:hypothetical protein